MNPNFTEPPPNFQFPDFSIPPPPLAVKSSQSEIEVKLDEPKTSNEQTNRKDSSYRSSSVSGKVGTISRNESQRRSSSRSSSKFSSRNSPSRKRDRSEKRRDDRDSDRHKEREKRTNSNERSSSYRKDRDSDRNHRSSSSYRSSAYAPRDSRSHRDTRSSSTRPRYSPSRQSTSRDHDRRDRRDSKVSSERERLLEKWRKNYCETPADISKKLEELANDEDKSNSWIRSSPADVYYKRVKNNVVESTTRLDALCTLFEEELLKRADKTRANQTPYTLPPRKRRIKVCRHKCKFNYHLNYLNLINNFH